MALAGCEEKEAKVVGKDHGVFSELPESDGLEGLPGETYELYGKSKIKWEPWTKASLALAEETDRLVIAFVLWPNHPSCGAVMNMLEGNAEVVAGINSSYVPILIDGNTCREMALLSARLCSEVKAPFQFPMVVWMTSKGNPVAWIPLTETNSSKPGEVFLHSHLMVSKMWNEAKDYVMENSSIDHVNRKKRIEKSFKKWILSKDPAKDSARALRQIISLYDPYSHTLDGIGGLFPTAALDLLALGARTEGLPEDLRESSRETLGMMVEDLLNSAMFDPLDGGVFSSRQGVSFVLPGFYRDCETQARVVVSLLDAYEVTGNELALKRAMEVLSYITETYKADDGLFALASFPLIRMEDWLWTMQDLEASLNEEELNVWVTTTGAREMGNLPFEVDPSRKFFRKNSLAKVLDIAAVAEETGMSEGEVESLFESGREKLLKVREARLGSSVLAKDAHAGATFRMVSAYASVFRITGDTAFREMANEVLTKARDHFAEGSKLNTYQSDAPKNLVKARAFVYGLAMQAALDVAAISGEDRWRIWAVNLATTVSEVFHRDGIILECMPEVNLIDLTIADREMIFEESTLGLLVIAKARLKQLGHDIPENFVGKSAGLPARAVYFPMFHTDLIQASLIAEYGVVLTYGKDVSPEMREAILRSPLKGVEVKFSPDASTAGGKVKKTSAGGTEKILSDPMELKVRNQ
ncbi:MAG: DUF255 domain-containing protein [Luteolibacter sp.]